MRKAIVIVLLILPQALEPAKAFCASSLPLGIYCVSLEQFKEIGQTKFNVILNPFWAQGKDSTPPYLEQCHRYGKKGTPGFDQERIKKGDSTYISDYVASMQKHPGLLAYYLSDEPSDAGVSPDAAEFAYRVIKNLDEGRPILLSHFRDGKAYANAYDIFLYDQYPMGNMPLARYRNLFREIVKEVTPKPVWAVIQVFGAGQQWKQPTQEELRCMTYLALIHGAQGLAFYMYGRPGDSYYIREHPEHWRAVKALAAELDGLSPVLLAKTSTQNVSAGHSCVDILLKEHRGHLYLLAVNWASGSSPVNGHYPGISLRNVRFSIPAVQTARIRVVGKPGLGTGVLGREFNMTQGSFQDDLDPYGVRVYKISSF